MSNTREKEKLIEVLHTLNLPSECDDDYEWMADRLIANGVTVQELDGCEYCKEDSEGFRRMFGAFSLVNPFHGKGWQIHAGKCKPREIHYCPMCGRKLSEPPKGE